MRRYRHPVTAVLLAALCVLTESPLAQSDGAAKWPTLSGPYLGQQPPGMEPELFAEGLVSTGDFELNAVFSPNGRIFMFSRRINGVYKMFFSRQTAEGTWTEPEIAGPSRTYPGHRDVDMVFSADQQWLYFISDRPLPGYSLDRYNIWRSRIGPHGLETPEPLGAHINGPEHELYPMLVADGSLYFSTGREDSLGQFDTYRAQFENGEFGDPVNIGAAINSVHSEGDIYVSPDEDFLIHVSGDRDDGLGRGDLHISFRQDNGQWSPSKNMGAPFNSEQTDYCPMMTPDGKYFFFSRGGDVYWVDARALAQFR